LLHTTGLATVGTTLNVTGNTTVGNLNTANAVTAGILVATNRADIGQLSAGATTLASGEITGSLVVGGNFTIVGQTLLDTDTIKLRATTKQTIGAGVGTGFVINRANSSATLDGTTDTITSNGHGFNNGQNVAFISLSTGVTGLSNNTIFRVVQKTDNTFKVASVGAFPTAIDFSTLSGATAIVRDIDNPDAQIRWNEVNRYWDIRDVLNSVDATSYSKILTANLISNSLTSTSAETVLSSQGANTLDVRIVTANTNMKNYVDVANTSMKSYVDTANTNLKNYSDSTFVRLNPASAQTIAQNLTLSGDVIISKNLTINGTVTTVNTQELNIADNEIVLNSDVPNNVAPTQNAGFIINRGSSTNTYIRWNETIDSWVANNGITAGEFRLANTTTYLTEGTNLYLTAARVRANVSNTAPILYNSSTGAFSHATSGVTAATHGSSISVPVFAVNAQGHVTSVSNTAIAFPAEADTLASVTGRGATTATAITINNTTASTSNSTGALIVRGGISANANARFDAVFDAGSRVISRVANTAPINAVVSANTLTLSHATSGVTAATHGSSISVPVFAVNAQGHVTSVSNTAIAFPAEADTLASVTGRGATTATAITINNTTASTSNSTGALIVRGGISANANARFDAVFDAGSRVISRVANTAPINAVVSANTLTLSHATSGVTAATHGSSISVPVFAVNAQGHVTSVTNTAIRTATTSQTGVIQLENSVSSSNTNTAAVPASVRTAHVHAQNAFNTANGAFTKANNAVQNGFVTIAANGTNIVADSNNDTFTLSSNTGEIDIQSNANTDTVTIGLRNTAVAAGTYGSSTIVPRYTVDAKGRITSAANVTIAFPAEADTLSNVVARGNNTTTGIDVGSLRIGSNAVINSLGQWVGSNSGLVGAQGAQGRQGAQGAVGAQGAQGFQGVVGAQGRQGFQGLVGAQGAQGRQGAQGAVGAQGAAGGFTTNSNAQVNSLGVGTAASGAQGEIRATGDITAYFSDDRLKNRLGDIENGLDKVIQLSGFYYEANEIAQQLGYTIKREVGVSAQEVQKVLPEVIAPAPIDEQYLTVKYERIVPLLIMAIKELKQQVDDIKNQLNNR
jgi:hypothetical protein